jgi:hypothetical protein
MPQIIDVPGQGQVEFPDGMSDAQIVAAIQRNTPRKPNAEAMNPEVNIGPMSIKGETSTGFNPAAAIIKAGQAVDSVNKGLTQLKYGPGDWIKEKLGMQPSGVSAALAADQEFAKQPMADLKEVHPGSTMIGDVAAAAGVPWRALPAVAAAEYGDPLERFQKGVATYLGGKLAQKGGEIASRTFSKSQTEATQQTAANAVRDGAVDTATMAGYKTVPSLSNGSLAGRIIEGATGKEKATQLAASENQPLTDYLVRKAFDLPDDAPLVHATMKAVREKASLDGYAPVRQVPRIPTDLQYLADVKALTSRADNAAKDFGALVESDVKPLAKKLSSIKSFTGDSAVDAVAIFREKASDLYANDNATLGKAYRKAAEAVEGQIDRSVAKTKPDLIPDYRAARTKMAQSFDVEKAIREGQGTVDAQVLGRLYGKTPDRMTGELALIGRTANAMPQVMAIPKAGWSSPVTAMDSGIGTLGGILAGNPAPLLFPALRVAGRYGLMSGPGQRMLTKPKYQPNALAGTMSGLLDNPMAPYVAGLLGYEATR